MQKLLISCDGGSQALPILVLGQFERPALQRILRRGAVSSNCVSGGGAHIVTPLSVLVRGPGQFELQAVKINFCGGVFVEQCMYDGRRCSHSPHSRSWPV
jgi:hypothetical protein